MLTRRIGVVVPAHDEAEVITSCLLALADAARAVTVPVHVVVVPDSCSDDTTALVAAADASAFLDLRSLVVTGRNVGAARAAGFADLLSAVPVAGTWLASTDADSTVPVDWFERQLHHAHCGTEVIAGTVDVVDWSPHAEATRVAYLQRYVNADGHRHVHGANLSFSAEAYAAVGGFAPLASDEDVELLDRLTRAGRRTLWAADLAVATSARLVGRAPAGFAGHLRGVSREAEAV